MPKVLFYCQHILGIGHFVRSMEIVRGLVKDFQVCFINGGQVLQGFQVPPSVEIVNIPAIKTDSEFQELQVADSSLSLEDVQAIRREQLLSVFERFQPDILAIELFPFGRRRFSFELIPLLEQAKLSGTKIVCSLRDIVVTKQNQARHEEKVCRLMNQYFDMLLIHGDPQFIRLEESFSRVSDLNCAVEYTGYVAQPVPETGVMSSDTLQLPTPARPIILASVGGGRFGHDLLECVVKTAPLLKSRLPHHIQMFTGPFIPEEVFSHLQNLALGSDNITIDRYTPRFLDYMKRADLSISMSGYNTTMNILMTGVPAMIMAFMGNDDQEQTIRAEKLAKLGIVNVIRKPELQPEQFAEKVVACLNQQPNAITWDFGGIEKTATCLRRLLQQQEAAA
ncbi:MAG TPA: glycosyl transferase [Cyanobacteria bacterium UBA8803]|nr:glycosyl transferase [Cyanobacteria bacterium UBA9273]HBL61704.1 glycosyl transferase [Cyanobacteria bacterium UBA8803]